MTESVTDRVRDFPDVTSGHLNNCLGDILRREIDRSFTTSSLSELKRALFSKLRDRPM